MKIFYTERSINGLGQLQKAGIDAFEPKEEIPNVHEFDRSSLLAYLKEFKPEGIVVGLKFQIDKEIMDQVNLKVIFTRTTGLDHIDTEYAKEKGIEVINLKGEELTDVRAVAELNLCMMIFLMRTVHKPGYELGGKTMGLIGFGRIGRQLAGMGLNLGMHIIYHDPAFPQKSIPLEKLLKESQIISLHVTAKEENRDMISWEQFAQMEQHPFFLNSSRPWLVDNKALKSALKEGLVSGAWIDFDLDFKAPNLLTSPHLGGLTMEATVRTEQIIIEKVIRYYESRNSSGNR